MDVSIIIVNWNVKDKLEKCLDSIVAKTVGLSYEVIIVDNNSKDDSITMVREKFLPDYPNFKLIGLEQNIGFPKANNHAIKECNGEYVFFLNPDTELITNVVFELYQAIQKYHCGAVGPKIVYPNGKIQFECSRDLIRFSTKTYSLLYLDKLFPNSKIFGSHLQKYWDRKQDAPVECLLGAAILMKKKDFLTCGMFCDKMYLEDVQLCFDIQRKLGQDIFFIADSCLIHDAGSSMKRIHNLERYIYYQYLLYTAPIDFIKMNEGRVKHVLIKAILFLTTLLFLFPVLIYGLIRKEFKSKLGIFLARFCVSLGLKL